MATFLCRDIEEIDHLRTALNAGTWAPATATLRRVRDPKPRLIVAAPFVDRVVHSALVDLMEPVFLPACIDTDWACRRSMGTHRAVLALSLAMRKYRYVVHLDIRAYFPSIDRAILRRLIACRIVDAPFLAVVDRILDAAHGLYADPRVRAWLRLPESFGPERGIPVGAHTSQFWATHVYLQGLDHHVKRVMKVPYYGRYVDDFFLFGDRRGELREQVQAVTEWLWYERALYLKYPNAPILPCVGPLDALGYRIRRDGWSALPVRFRKLRAQVHAALGTPDAPEAEVKMQASLQGILATLLF